MSWEKMVSAKQVPNIHKCTPYHLHHLLPSELKGQGTGKGLRTFLSFVIAETNFCFQSEGS